MGSPSFCQPSRSVRSKRPDDLKHNLWWWKFLKKYPWFRRLGRTNSREVSRLPQTLPPRPSNKPFSIAPVPLRPSPKLAAPLPPHLQLSTCPPYRRECPLLDSFPLSLIPLSRPLPPQQPRHLRKLLHPQVSTRPRRHNRLSSRNCHRSSNLLIWVAISAATAIFATAERIA